MIFISYDSARPLTYEKTSHPKFIILNISIHFAQDFIDCALMNFGI